VATLVGNPNATRAVGTAMATNPIPIVVPCHRVLRSGGALGNYGGGPEVKAWLLRHEGARILL
jgi:methylated-DNA-[protein]-cysteine S-methyltransferase